MAFLATDLRPPRADGGERITRLAAETGAAGIHLGGGCDLEILTGAPLVGTALRLGLEIPTVALPLAERILPAGRRLPRLAAPARDEREAAIALAAHGLAAAGSFGAQIAVVDFGPVALTADAAAFALAFARRAVGQRRSRAGSCWRLRWPNAARWRPRFWTPASGRSNGCSAPPTAPACDWLSRSGSPPGSRSARARPGSLRETFGAALGVAWDPGRLSLLATLELPVGDDRLKSLAAAAVVVMDNDAVGVEAGYLPGLGERAERLARLLTAGLGPPRGHRPSQLRPTPRSPPRSQTTARSSCRRGHQRTGSTRCRLNICARCSSSAGDTAAFTS